MNSLFTRMALFVAFVTVSFGVNAQSINSTLNNRPGVTVGVNEDFTVTLTPGALSPFTNVKLAIVLATPAQSANISLSLQNPQTSVYEPLVFDGSGNSVSQAAPFFLIGTLNAKVTFTAAGTYNYSLRVLDGTTNAILANSNEQVIVAAPPVFPTISSTLNGQTILTGAQTTYGVSTTTGDFAGTMVKVFFKMNPSQVPATTIQYFEVQSSTWQPFPIGVNGEAVFGPSTGFPLNPATTQFRVTYSAPGVYNYKLSVFKAATPNDTLAVANEAVTVVNPTPPTIFSSVASDTLTRGVQTPYSVSTTTGDYAGTMVRVFFKMSPSQVANGVTEYFEPQLNAWVPFTVNGNGEAIFGASGGFPLAATSSQFRVTYSATGTYNYKMAILRASNLSDTLAIANEHVVVVDPELPTISSTLNNMPGVLTGALVNYTVTTVANDYAGTMVRGYFKLNNTAQVADANLSYEVAPGTFLPLTINANGEGFFGPGSGFPLASTSTNFQAIFDAAGTYGYKIAIYDVATNDTLAFANESVTVFDYIAPTVESTLDGMNLFTGDEASYQVTTTTGSESGTLVRGFFALQNTAQANDVNITYNDGTGNFLPLTIGANGTGFFGPVSGFPLANASSDFKAIFDAAGTYTYKIYVVEVATGDTLAFNSESVTVVDYIDPTISSTLNGQTLDVAEVADFQVTTTDGSEAGTLVRGFVKLNTASQAGDVNLQYEVSAGTFAPLTLDANGQGFFGPVGGFPLGDVSTNFKASFDAAGVYGYKLYIIEVATTDTLATSSESVTVVVPIPTTPEISSDLDERANVVVNTEELFTVTTVKNNAPNANVRIKITLENPVQADSINLEFENPVSGTFEQLTFDANGVAFAGSVTGFALTNADYDFKISFIGGGLYEYNLALVNVAGNTELADNGEEVFVLDNSSISENNSIISSVFPNPTTGNITIQTQTNGVGNLNVFTVTGNKVMSTTINGSTNTISMEILPAGVYIIRISQGGNEAVIRVVKN